MTSTTAKPRRQQILEAFARMLQASPGVRITTAALAREVGVSEAALYRHFPSKTKMFEGLIDNIEEAIIAPATALAAQDALPALERCREILHVLLDYAERNPGMTRILTADALAGETERLHLRVVHLFERLEVLLKQVLREAELTEGLECKLAVSATVQFWLATAEGRIAQFVRGEYKQAPSLHWREYWPCLTQGFIQHEELALS